MSGCSCFSLQLLAVGRSWEWMDAAAAVRGWEKLLSREGCGGGGAAPGGTSPPQIWEHELQTAPMQGATAGQ